MKKYIFLIFILTMSIGLKANAQIQILPEIGISMLKKKNINTTVSPRVGIKLSYDFQGNSRWAIISGLYFYQKKEAYTTEAIGFQDAEGKYQEYPFTVITQRLNEIVDKTKITRFRVWDFDTKRDYLQIPLLAQYKWRLNDLYAISIAVGPYVAVGVGGKNQITDSNYYIPDKTSSSTQTSENTFNLNMYNRFDMGLSSQAAINVHNFVFNLGYETNLYRRQAMGKEHNITMGVGYLF